VRARLTYMGLCSLTIALGLASMMSCSAVSSGNSGHASNQTTAGTSDANGVSGSPQYLYTVNRASETISGFAINSDGTLSPLPNFPVTSVVPASSLSAAKRSLLVGGCDANATCGISLYSIAQNGNLTLASSTSTAGSFSVALDPSAGSAYATGGMQANPSGTVSAFSTTGGNLSPLPGSPYLFSIGNGSNPVSSGPIAVDPSGKFLYMGSITPQNEHTPAGSFGMALRNPDGSLSGFTTTTGCISAGSVAAAPEQGSSFVYASCVDDWSGMYWIADMIMNQTAGSATTNGASFVSPDPNELLLGLAADPSGRWLAVSDVNNNVVHVMSINPATGALSDSPDHVFPTGTGPNAAAFDQAGKFLYVLNGGYAFAGTPGSNNISAFAFNAATGMLTPLPGSPYSTGQSPSALAIAQP
jgi:Lactonase, 7-bladed beta-propeller